MKPTTYMKIRNYSSVLAVLLGVGVASSFTYQALTNTPTYGKVITEKRLIRHGIGEYRESPEGMPAYEIEQSYSDRFPKKFIVISNRSGDVADRGDVVRVKVHALSEGLGKENHEREGVIFADSDIERVPR